MGIAGTGYRSSFFRFTVQGFRASPGSGACTAQGRHAHGSLASTLAGACLALVLSGLFAAPAQAEVFFEEIPQAHNGRDAFLVRVFINPAPSSTPSVTATHTTAPHPTVNVSAVGNSRHAYRITVRPSSDSPITLRVPGGPARQILGGASDARVKDMWLNSSDGLRNDDLLWFRIWRGTFQLDRSAFGHTLQVQTHRSDTTICIFDDTGGSSCSRGSRKSMRLDPARSAFAEGDAEGIDRSSRARIWTVRVISSDGKGFTRYHVKVGSGAVNRPKFLDCTFDMFDSLTVTPSEGTVESVVERGCRRYIVTLRDPGNRLENHQFRGNVLQLSAAMKSTYPNAQLYLDWSDFYAGRRYTRLLSSARPELRLNETMLYLRVRLPHGTVDRRSVDRTSWSGGQRYEHLNFPIKVVRKRGGGSQKKAPAPLTASFENAPESHNGSAFSFRIAFSDDVDIEPEEMRDHALTVSGGTVSAAARVDSRNDLWEFTVEPAGTQAISVSARSGRACTEQGALCTSDGRRLSSGLSKKVFPYATWIKNALEPTLPGLSIADAEVQEAPNARLVFSITLSQAASEAVTFQIGTSNGTATAGQDYIAKSKTKTFAPGQTTGVFKVKVRDDDHDEGEETLAVTISNASGARIVDGTATGTIVNSDAMPQDWLARFGRTVAEQVLEAVETRLSGTRSPGVRVQVGGQALDADTLRASDERLKEAEMVEQDEARAQLQAIGRWLGPEGLAHVHGFKGQQDASSPYPGGRASLNSHDLLTGTSFNLTDEAGAGALVSLWGRGAVSHFDGRTDALSMDGEVETLMLGTDWSQGAWTTGVLLSHSRGDGDWRGESEGRVESTLSGVWPYGRYRYGQRLSLWGIAGYGEGEMDLEPEGVTAMETDMDLVMGSIGVHGIVRQAPETGGLELAIISDALAVRTSSDSTAGLASSEADVTRIRLGLEGTWQGLEAGAGTWVPHVELGIRRDGGDAETGLGADLGTGLTFRHATAGVSAELRARALIAHEESGFESYGFSGSLAWDPSPASHHGPTLTLSQTMGAPDSGGMEALLGRATMAGLYPEEPGTEADHRQLELRVGYGFGISESQWVLTPELGLGHSTRHREYQFGTRLDLAGHGPGSPQLAFRVRRQEYADDPDDPEHAIGLQLRVHF